MFQINGVTLVTPAWVQADLEAPVLATPVQDNAALTITVSSNPGSSSLDTATWQYTRVHGVSTCLATSGTWRKLTGLDSQANLGTSQASLTLSSSHSSRLYCFRVADENGNYGYSSVLTVATIYNPPVISNLRQANQEVHATATDDNLIDHNGWQYAVIAKTDACNNSVVSTWSNTGVTSTNVSNSTSRLVLDLAASGITSSQDGDNDKQLCVRIDDNIDGNHGYRSLVIDVTPPEVTASQENQTLSAKAGSNQGARSSTWQYVKDENSFTCDKDAFTSRTAVRSSRVSLLTEHVNDYFCFRVADNFNNYGYDDYQVTSLDTTAPEIKAPVQNNAILTVSAYNPQDIDATTWGFYRTGSSTEPTACASSGYTAIPSTLQIELLESDIGNWICIRVADQADNYAYHKVKIRSLDASAPTVTVQQVNDRLLAETTATDIDAATWQYAKSAVNDPFDCSSSNTALSFNSVSSSNSSVRLTAADRGRYYCFRVSDLNGNDGYGRSNRVAVVESSPQIDVVQRTELKRLEVSTTASDVDGLTWGWAVFTLDPGDCSTVTTYTSLRHSQTNANTNRIYISNIGDSQDGSYYCFRVADTSTVYSTPNYGYAKHRYDLTAPTIKFSFDATAKILTVFSDDTDIAANTWRYAYFTSRPDCSVQNINSVVPTSGKFTLSNQDNGRWFCFRVSDQSGNETTVVYGVSGIGTTAQAPVVSVVQNTPERISVSSSSMILDTSTWRYSVSVNEPVCRGEVDASQLKIISPTSLQISLTTVADDKNWVCVQVSDTNQLTGYAKLLIDRQAPDLTVSQNRQAITVESQDTDLDLDSWGYVRSTSNINCKNASLSYTDLDFSSSSIEFDIDVNDSQKYYCFRVSDNVGHSGYVKVRVAKIEAEAPVVIVNLVNKTLKAKASNVKASTWQYARSSSDINCSDQGRASFRAASSKAHTVKVKERDNGFWFCFRVKGSNNVYGYAKKLVNNIDTTPPQIVVKKQAKDVVAVTAPASQQEVIKQWHYVILKDAETCDKEVFKQTERIHSGNLSTVAQASKDTTYCFRAQDAAGNEGFSSFTVAASSTDATGAQTPVVTDNGQTTTGSNQSGTDQDSEGDEESDRQWMLWIGLGLAGLVLLILIVIFIANSGSSKQNGFDDDYIQ